MFIGEWRKYQRPLIVVVFGGIAFSFLFFGAGDPQVLVDAVLNRDPMDAVTLGSVDDEPITIEEFGRALDRVREQRTAQGGEPPSNQQLWEEGAVWAAWDDLVNAKLVEVYAQRDGYEFMRPFLVEQMKKMPDFQLPDGGFDGRAWNEWVNNPRVDWEHWYDQLNRGSNLQLFTHRALSSARVLESELRDRFELENTQFTLRYASLEPAFEPTEEDIQARYEMNPSVYFHPQQWKVTFARLRLEPEITADLDAITSLANGGEPLGSLAQIYAGQPLNATMSEIGWVDLTDTLPELRAPLRDLAVGQTSAAVRSGSGFLIYKVVEESFSEPVPAVALEGDTPAASEGDTEAAPEETPEATEPMRSVRVEQLVIRPQLSPEERAVILEEAGEILERARAEGFDTVAEEYGLEVFTTPLIDVGVLEIEGVPTADQVPFRNGLQPRYNQGEFTDLVTGQVGAYIIRIDEKPPRRERPMEEVRQQIVTDLQQEYMGGVEFREELATLGAQVKDSVDSLDAIATAFPNVTVDIQDLAPFTVPTFSYATGLRWNIREVAEAAAELEPGQMGGPFSDFIGRTVYFIELVDKQAPSEETWEQTWPEQKEQMLMMATNGVQNQQFEDYLLYLRDRAVEELDVRRNDGLILQYLGLSQPGTDPVSLPVVEPAAESSK